VAAQSGDFYVFLMTCRAIVTGLELNFSKQNACQFFQEECRIAPATQFVCCNHKEKK
jgi:hypothetical protein